MQDASFASGLSARLFVLGDDAPTYRYSIINGNVPKEPDLRIPATGFESATDSLGYYYATDDKGNVDVFPPGRVLPSRWILVKIPLKGVQSFASAAITVDSQGYLYYGYQAFLQNSTFRYGVLIYAPGASGNAAPVRSILLGHPAPPATVRSLATDNAGRLYISGLRGGSNSIVVYNHPVTGPKIARIITGTGLTSPLGITVDTDGTLYVVNNSGSGSISVYGSHARGAAKPIRVITITTSSTLIGHVAILGRDAFVIGGPQNTFFEFKKLVAGAQEPLATILTPATPIDLAISTF